MTSREEQRSVRRAMGADRAAELEEVRRLLLVDERQRIDRLETRGVDVDSVANVLPDAILRREAKDDRVERALASTIENGLFRSARKDPQGLADAIYPALGPAIRSMIQSSLRQSLEALNVALENALSPQGVKWRLQAARTGRPFSEVVLLNTLVYRVEHVLLVDRETGLVASELAAPEAMDRDGDLLAGMLSAIRDFASDSLGASQDDRLQEIELGGLTMIVAQGPYAVLALVVRGNPPRALHTRTQTAVDQLHVEYGQELAGFDGEASRLVGAEPFLEDLLEQEAKKPVKNPWVRLIPVAAAVLLVGWLGLGAWRGMRARADLGDVEAALRVTPGFVLTEARLVDGGIEVEGLVDPLVGDPTRIAAAALGDRARPVRFHTKPYASLDAPILLARVRASLDLPDFAALTLRRGTLRVEGLAPGDPAVVRLLDRGPLLAGIERVEICP